MRNDTAFCDHSITSMPSSGFDVQINKIPISHLGSRIAASNISYVWTQCPYFYNIKKNPYNPVWICAQYIMIMLGCSFKACVLPKYKSPQSMLFSLKIKHGQSKLARLVTCCQKFNSARVTKAIIHIFKLAVQCISSCRIFCYIWYSIQCARFRRLAPQINIRLKQNQSTFLMLHIYACFACRQILFSHLYQSYYGHLSLLTIWRQSRTLTMRGQPRIVLNKKSVIFSTILNHELCWIIFCISGSICCSKCPRSLIGFIVCLVVYICVFFWEIKGWKFTTVRPKWNENKLRWYHFCKEITHGVWRGDY